MYMSDGGFSTSDEILDRGREGLSFFADFIPVYDEAASLAGPGRYRGITFPNDVQRPFDEQRGIDFSMFRTDAEHLNAAVERTRDHLSALDRYWGSLSSWTGQASEAAKSHHDRFNQQAGDFISKAAPASGAISGGAANIQGAVGEYAEAVYQLYSEKCGGMTPQEVRGAIELAKGNVDSSNAQYMAAKMADVTSGFLTFGVGWLLDYLGWGVSDMVREQLMQAAKQSLRNFVREFDSKKQAFDDYTRVTQQSIQRDYDTMINAMRPMSHEAFRELPQLQPQGVTTPAGTTQPGGIRPHTPPRPAGAQPTTPSGARPPAGATPTRPPTIPGAGQPTVPSGATPPIAPTQPPTIPGQPGTLPGQQLPGQLPGQIPGQVPPVALPGQGQPVTIRHGNTTITATPPDASGRVRLTVSDGSGPPKTYDLDFGRGTTTSSGAGSFPTPGATPPFAPPVSPGGGTPGATPPMIPPISPIGGRPGSPGSSGSPTAPAPRLPSSMFPFSDKPAQQVHPDEDGHMVIHDGDATITVDADDLTDKLTITVDDGHGHTTSYTVDYHDPAHPTLHEGADATPHLFGPTGSSSLPSTPHLAPVGFTPEHAGALGGHGGGGIGGGHGGGGGGIGAGAVPSHAGAGAAGQLQAGSYTGGQSSGPPPGQTLPAAAGPGGGGGPGGGTPGGMPMMGGMGAGGAKGGGDQERGANRFLGKEDVFTDDSSERRKAVKAGGVIGEDKKK